MTLANENQDIQVIISSFQGLLVFTDMSRKPGQEVADVLDESKSESAGSTWKNLYNYVTGASTSNNVTRTKNAEINIFSVASGHLYERFLRIMILSVMKHTKHTGIF